MADSETRTGSRYADQSILEFTERLHAPNDPVLEQAFQAPEQNQMPAIQISATEGKTLTLLLRLVAARKVIEVGTLAGYSALRIAAALPWDGRLISLELLPKHAEVARRNIAAAGLADKVEVRVGDALELLEGLQVEAPVDAVFIDADKGRYPEYLEWAVRLLRPGGLLLADNVYLFGRLLEDSAEAAAMRRFHEQAARLFDSVCLPTPDGMLVGIRHS